MIKRRSFKIKEMASFAKADTSEAVSNVGRILNFPRIYIKYDYKLQKPRGEFKALLNVAFKFPRKQDDVKS